MEPESGSWSVAIVRMSVDFPAPLGPSKPNMPAGMSSETSCRARTPLAYVFERFAFDRFMKAPARRATEGDARWRATMAIQGRLRHFGHGHRRLACANRHVSAAGVGSGPCGSRLLHVTTPHYSAV